MKEVNKRHDEAGFTLVELSIVLVIIGLIVGGILVGQDMIKAAEIRSTVSQLAAYNSAMNTFRDKYRYLPGDISATAAGNAGLLARAGTAGHGDGNGFIEGGASGATTILGEVGLIWRDLNQAGMLDGDFVTATDAAPTAVTTPDGMKNFLPEAKIGRGNLITAYASEGVNFYQLSAMTAMAATGVPTLSAALTPQESLNLDQKTDDGVPQTGSTRAMAVTGLNAAAAVGTAVIGSCLDATAAPGRYNTAAGTGANTAEANSNSPACSMRFRFN